MDDLVVQVLTRLMPCPVQRGELHRDNWAAPRFPDN
jgi:hypothetical protein